MISLFSLKILNSFADPVNETLFVVKDCKAARAQFLGDIWETETDFISGQVECDPCNSISIRNFHCRTLQNIFTMQQIIVHFQIGTFLLFLTPNISIQYVKYSSAENFKNASYDLTQIPSEPAVI